MRKAAGHTDESKRRSIDQSRLVANARLAEPHELSQVLLSLYNLLERTQNSAQRASDAHEQRYLTPDEAAAYINVSPSWLNRAKARNEGPVWISLGDTPGSPVRYDIQDLDTWMRNRRSTKVTDSIGGLSPIPFDSRQNPVRKMDKYKSIRFNNTL